MKNNNLTAKLKPIRKNTPRSTADLPTAALPAEDTHTPGQRIQTNENVYKDFVFQCCEADHLSDLNEAKFRTPHPPKKRQPFSTVSMYVDI